MILANFVSRLNSWKRQLDSYCGYRLDISGVNLQRAILNSKRPDASDVVFGGAILSDARIEGASLINLQLQGAILRGARLDGSISLSALMNYANLREARLERSQMMAAEFKQAFMSKARMELAQLNSAQIQGAVLDGAQMQCADFVHARIDRANLQETNLDLVSLKNNDLTCCRSLTTFQITMAYGDGSVTLPGGHGPDSAEWPRHWPKSELNGTEYWAEYRKWRASPATYTPPLP